MYIHLLTYLLYLEYSLIIVACCCLVEYGISVDDAAARQQCDNTTEYVCANGHTCIALELVNNTVNDCGDNSDEGK